MLILNKKEVYIGYSINKLFLVLEILDNESIKYTYKIKHVILESRGYGYSRGIFVISKKKIPYEKEYIVYVKKKDFDKAQYLINKILLKEK